MLDLIQQSDISGKMARLLFRRPTLLPLICQPAGGVPSINSSCMRLAHFLQPECFSRLHVGRFKSRRRLYSEVEVYAGAKSGSRSGRIGSSSASNVMMMETTDLWNGSHFAHRR